MATPKTAAGLTGLTAIIDDPTRALLAFDFDGVLSPIVDDPEQAQPFPGMFAAIASLGRKVGSIAVITGRPLSFVMSRSGFNILASIPEFKIFGHYGLERWDSATQTLISVPPSAHIAVAREELRSLLKQGIADGAWLEDKGNAVAVHTRRAADPAGALDALSDPVRELAERHHLLVEPGRMVLELRPHGVHKGDVLREIALKQRLHGLLFAGDDLGDLSAFAVVDQLREAGVAGIKVCSGSAEAAAVAEAADLVVDGPAGIVKLLTYLREQIERARPATGYHSR